MLEKEKKMSKRDFTNQKPFVVSKEDLKRPWGGRRDGRYFRCGLCGHFFREGDITRWIYLNGSTGFKYGNKFVCENCDCKDVVKKFLDLQEEWERMRNEKFWIFVRSMENIWKVV